MTQKKTERRINEPMKVILQKSEPGKGNTEYQQGRERLKKKSLTEKAKCRKHPGRRGSATLGRHEEPQRARGVREADLKDTPNMRHHLFGFLDRRHVSIGRCGGCWNSHVLGQISFLVFVESRAAICSLYPMRVISIHLS